MVTSAIAPDALLLGKYRVERELGKGGMGVVVQARHIELDESVAIKLLHENLSANQELFARFAREAKAAARLKSRHVVRVSDVGRLPDGMPYMVMELLDGMDLSHLLKQHGPLPVPYACDLALQALEVLAEAHAYGIVHRDVKPSNLFVTTGDDGKPLLKLLDFGIAKAPEATNVQLTQTSSTLGSPAYMSPEQLRSSRNVDHRADIWALGVALHELVEGVRPFVAESYSELCMKIGVDPPTYPISVPSPLAEILLKCLEKDPADRYQNAMELALALQPYAGDQAGAQQEIDRMYRVRASSDRLRRDSTPTPTPAPTPAPPTPTPRGRMHGTAEISGDAPPPPSEPDLPATTPGHLIGAVKSASAPALPAAPVRRRGQALVLVTALVVIAAGVGIYFAWPARPAPSSPAAPSAPSTVPMAPLPQPAPPIAQQAPQPAAVPDAGVEIDAAVQTVEQATEPKHTPVVQKKQPHAKHTTETKPTGSAQPPAQPQQPPAEEKKKSDPHFIDKL